MRKLIDRLQKQKAKKSARSQVIVIRARGFDGAPDELLGVVGGRKKAREAILARLEKEERERATREQSAAPTIQPVPPAAPDSARQPQRDNQAEPREPDHVPTQKCWRCHMNYEQSSSRCCWCSASSTPSPDHPDGICGTQP
jgi:hypothetical protein